MEFEDSRKVLKKVARINLQDENFIDRNFNFKFDTEIGKKNEMSV